MIDTKENEERGRMICQTLAYVVESLVEPSEFATAPYQQPSKFEAFRAPGISVRDYLMRIHKYASCSPECFVLALVYIDRLQRMQGFVLTELNVHRVVITSVVLAAKFFDDHYFNNAYYAKVGGVLCKEMNELEIEYLLLINFSLHVPTDTYARFYNDLSNHYTFTSVRSPYMQPSPYYQLHHYVAEDPENDGQLMYFTDYVPRVPETRNGYHHSRGHPQGAYAAGSVTAAPSGVTPSAAASSSSPTPKSSAVRINTTTARASGQKRRSAVALGVNA
ncbi:hypothetical protein PybrP1_005585 [[Pythium] brassicae (nom. inval.)]|nr:hypothetical protein PybrP1_005585 [[Pythium] brassicae (nom. inval.)]